MLMRTWLEIPDSWLLSAAVECLTYCLSQFDDKYYRTDPADGGERAAVDLRAAVRQHLQSLDGALAGLPVVVKAFASGEGLAYILSKAAIIKQGDAADAVSRFTRGFSQADDLFDFVLVGKGKDRADHKLMGECRVPSSFMLFSVARADNSTMCQVRFDSLPKTHRAVESSSPAVTTMATFACSRNTCTWTPSWKR